MNKTPAVNAPMIFSDSRFGMLRVMKNEAENWFVARDVCAILGFDNSHTAMALAGLDADEKATIIKLVGLNNSSGLRKDTLLISEAGLYSLILRSNRPEAKLFKRWVTHEVLPTIRKTGGYLMASTADSPEEILARAVLVAQDTIKRVAQQRDEALRTKAEIGSRREATAMATASAAIRRANRAEAMLGLAGDYLAVKGIPWLAQVFDISKASVYSQVGKMLKRLSMTHNYEVKSAPDSLHESVGLYHKDIIAMFKAMLFEQPAFMAKYRYGA